MGDYKWTTIRFIQGDTRSLDHGSYRGVSGVIWGVYSAGS